MPYSVGVFTVATNIYVDYWIEMVRTADQFLLPGHRKTFYVFTDQPEKALRISSSLTDSQVVAFEVPPHGWPEATLFRYRFICEHAALYSEDVLMHMDADLAVVAEVRDLQPDDWTAGLCFVRHPGFRRPISWRRRLLYLRHPRLWHRDRAMLKSRGGLGAWEERSESRAFVPRERRETYVYGAIWMGRRGPFLDMCRELRDAVDEDLRHGLIAVWHDESHLNRFASESARSTLDSEFCYVPGWPNLADLHPRIVAVDKGSHLTR